MPKLTSVRYHALHAARTNLAPTYNNTHNKLETGMRCIVEPVVKTIEPIFS